MTDTTLTDAIREAYASAPVDDVVYHTLEIRHPDFTAPIRVVRDWADLAATLEDSAPEDAGTEVTFIRFAFDFMRPEMSSAGVPQMTIEIDNVDRSIVANIEAAAGSPDRITVIYREYLSSDLSAPQNDPPLSLTVLSVTADVFRVRAVCGWYNMENARFPTLEYSPETFPGLIA